MFAASFRPAPTARPSVIAEGQKSRRESRKLKHLRIRQKVSGTEERPRLCVFRSNHHIYCQVIDDSKGHTLAAASTQDKGMGEQLGDAKAPTVDAAMVVGKQIAEKCVEKGITKVCFDRAGYAYHGRVKAVADAAREGGLVF